MSTNEPIEMAKVVTRRVIIAGFFMALLGMISIAAPLMAGVSIAILVGAMVTTGGISQVAFAFQGGSTTSGGQRVLNFLLGGLTILAGVLMMCHPLFGLGFMTILLVAFFWVSGIGEIIYAFQLRPASGWVGVLASGAISFLLGVLIWNQFPLSGAWAIGVLVGVKLLVYGISLAVLGIAGRTMVHEEEESGGFTPVT